LYGPPAETVLIAVPGAACAAMPEYGSSMKGIQHMWMPKDLIDRILRLFRSAPVTEVETYHQHPQGLVFARAKPETVRIVEKYSYQQEISRNEGLQPDPGHPPTGEIRMVVPYDGDHYFTRQAKADVAGQLPPHNHERTDALVGHLVLTNYGKADLGDAGNQGGDVTALPIRVPVSWGRLPLGYSHLTNDLGSCVLTHDYRPDPSRPEIYPVAVSLTLLDPDSAEFLKISELDDDDTEELRTRLPALRTFEPYLQLRIKVQVHVAGGSRKLGPTVSRISIRWPKITSLSSFDLLSSKQDIPIRYNPDSQSLEWRDVPMTVARGKDETKQAADKREKPDGGNAEKGKDEHGDDDGDQKDQDGQASDKNKDENHDENKKAEPKPEPVGTDPDEAEPAQDEPEPAIRTYESPVMILLVRQPGELYREPKLQATVDVRIPLLLSGMEARLYGGTGVVNDDEQLEMVSEVSTKVEMILDDAFAERIVSTSQHLHFEEVVPDAARIEDIRNALVGHGFRCERDRELSSAPYQHLLVYRKHEGPDVMKLFYLIEGERFTTDRERVVAGDKYVTPIESGDLKIFGYGMLRTSSREVTRAMNELQKVLRPQFAHVRTRR
jgi:hypothetical protein